MTKINNSLDLLFPPVRDQAEKFLKQVEQYGFFIYETYRSFETQLEYFKKGRELKNGVWVVVDSKAIVTKAKPGFSMHAYGLAFDSIVDSDLQKQGIQWSWNDTYKDANGKVQKTEWKKVGAIGKSLGLEWAGEWKSFAEMPHFQNTFGFKVSELYQILTSNGLDTVWKKVMEKVPAIKQSVVVSTTISSAPVPIAPVVITEEDLDSKTDIIQQEKQNDSIFVHVFKIIEIIFSLFKNKK